MERMRGSTLGESNDLNFVEVQTVDFSSNRARYTPHQINFASNMEDIFDESACMLKITNHLA